jgi:hypothetical protein
MDCGATSCANRPLARRNFAPRDGFPNHLTAEGPAHQYPPMPSSRRRHRSHRGPLFPTIWFSIVGINWCALITLAVIYLRPRPLTTTDFAVVGIGLLMGLFYFWVAYAVYRRRRYIIDIAFVCAGLGLLSIPLGTCFSIMLLSSLMARKHDFTK